MELNDLELTTETNIKVLSHTDLDGHGTKIVLKSMGFKPSVQNLENTQVDAYIEEYVTNILQNPSERPELLLITDISPSPTIANLLEELYQTTDCVVRLFDHHATALHLNQYDWAKVVIEENGNKACGTSLVFDYLIEQGVQLEKYTLDKLIRFVFNVRLYDTWEWESYNKESAKLLNDLFYIIGPKEFVKKQIENIRGDSSELLSKSDLKLLEIESARIEKYLYSKNKEFVTIKDFFQDEEGKYLNVAVVQADNYISELGHYICEENPDIDFVMMIQLTKGKVSLRAVKESIDLTPIVTKYEGGGHPHAAGCSLISLGYDFLKKVFDEIK